MEYFLFNYVVFFIAPSNSESEPESPLYKSEVTKTLKSDNIEEESSRVELDLSIRKRTRRHSQEPAEPKFITKLDNKEIFESLPITLICEVYANPEAEISWYKNDVLIESNERYLIESDGGLCVLRIERCDLDDEGEYKCVAKNELGSDNTYCELLVESKLKFSLSSRFFFSNFLLYF